MRTDARTDRHDEALVALRSFANAPKELLSVRLVTWVRPTLFRLAPDGFS